VSGAAFLWLNDVEHKFDRLSIEKNLGEIQGWVNRTDLRGNDRRNEVDSEATHGDEMGDSGGEPPEHADSPRAHIQPSRGLDIDEELPADERLDRLVGDADMLYHLQVSNYAPDVWSRPGGGVR
jgi:hypothetical protein